MTFLYIILVIHIQYSLEKALNTTFVFVIKMEVNKQMQHLGMKISDWYEFRKYLVWLFATFSRENEANGFV